jgi:SAM-dependent methyltransferase
MEDKTLSFYNLNAEKFAGQTLNVEFQDIQNKFLSYLSPKSLILDFGCGSGRDTRYFLSKGYRVEATDGSEELCEIASKETGILVRNEYFQDLIDRNKYDAIWACASILHLPYAELISVFNKIHNALKVKGILYTSFKYGDYEGMRNGRYFTDFTKERLDSLLKYTLPFEILEQFITNDVRPDRENEKWLNVILKKKEEI